MTISSLRGGHIPMKTPCRYGMFYTTTGLCKKVGARLGDKFSPATASPVTANPGRPCHAMLDQSLLYGQRCTLSPCRDGTFNTTTLFPCRDGTFLILLLSPLAKMVCLILLLLLIKSCIRCAMLNIDDNS